jgi:hypothetical protein
MLLSALPSFNFFMSLSRFGDRFVNGGGSMEGRKVLMLNEDKVEHNEGEAGETVVERTFKVNELVEFREGLLVRG